MAEAKPFASLSSGLLARKGAAKPAMRPQGWGQGASLEDLGWNDMGHHQHAPAQPQPERAEHHQPSSISALTPAPRSMPAEVAPAPPPPVVEQQRAIQASFAEPVAEPVKVELVQAEPKPVQAEPVKVELVQAEPKPVQAEPVKPEPVKPQPVKVAAAPAPRGDVVSLPPRQRRAPGTKDKAAFTLRLAADRHLKLRLACAVTHRSAQQIVTDALDAFLKSLPEVDAMAGQVPAKLGKR